MISANIEYWNILDFWNCRIFSKISCNTVRFKRACLSLILIWNERLESESFTRGPNCLCACADVDQFMGMISNTQM